MEQTREIGRLAFICSDISCVTSVVGKWLGIQATVGREDTLEKVKALLEHEAFDINNPNNVYSVIGGFCMGNPYGFHSRGEESYEFLADQVIRLDPKNPQVRIGVLGDERPGN